MFKNLCLTLTLLLVGCSSSGPGPNQVPIKLETTGPAGKLEGTLKPDDPGAAGMAGKNIDMPIPGVLEFPGGPAEYSLVLNGLPSTAKLTISVDGKELKRGQDMIWEDDKGPRISFSVKAPAATGTP